MDTLLIIQLVQLQGTKIGIVISYCYKKTMRGERFMALLKAYKNLDLRPNGVDSLGRLTALEERSIRDQFNDIYGKDRLNLDLRRLDLAVASSIGLSPWQLMITIRSKELPRLDRNDDPETIIGVMIGHLASKNDRATLKTFLPIRQTLPFKPQIDAAVDASPSILIIDAFYNDSSYPIATMTAFLLRKVQASRFGHCMTFLFWPSTRIDVKLGTQLVKFGYRPYGIMNFRAIQDAIFKNGKCLAMWTSKTKDSREG
jgi:hypothetical protein